MTGAPLAPPPVADPSTDFRESRLQSLISINLHTYWAVVIIVMAFTVWDYYADPVHWSRAFIVRVLGASVCAASGLFQTLPGKARWLPTLAKVRMIVAATIAPRRGEHARLLRVSALLVLIGSTIAFFGFLAAPRLPRARTVGLRRSRCP